MLKGVPPLSLPNRPIEKQIIRLLCQRINSQNKSFLHLPPELLQIIFEFAVEQNQRGFKCATRISHVSQKMRRIAFSTPRLWSYIQCSMAKSESSITEFWDRTLDRVKHIPVDIVIQRIAEPKTCHLVACRLDKVAPINSLALESRSFQCMLEIQSPLFTPPTCPLNRLSIRVEIRAGFDNWDNAIFTRFPPITQLSLYGLPNLDNNQNSLSGVQSLQLDEMGLNLADFLPYFPDLTYLDIGLIYFLDYPSSPFVLPNLRTLKVWDGSTWIYQITCPNITTFIVSFLHSGPVLDDVMLWISLHPTIIRLESGYIEDYEVLSVACPQIEHLVIRNVRNNIPPDSLQLPRFRALKSLGLYVLAGDMDRRSTMENFEQIVSLRCLPASHVKSQLAIGEQVLEKLDILFQIDKRQRPVYIGGTLYQEARKTLMLLDVWELERLAYIGDEWLQMSLSWV
jgi:hypothetical protein